VIPTGIAYLTLGLAALGNTVPSADADELTLSTLNRHSRPSASEPIKLPPTFPVQLFEHSALYSVEVVQKIGP
jgi:hypothetical protein